MQKHFEILLKTRQLLLKITENLTDEQLNKIPQGFKNNIAWNIGHLVVMQWFAATGSWRLERSTVYTYKKFFKDTKLFIPSSAPITDRCC